MNIKTDEQHHAEDLQRIANFRLMDDDFFTACFRENRQGIQFLLRIILDAPKLRIRKSEPQKILKNLYGRSIVPDVYAVGSNRVVYNLEIENSTRGAAAKRARYHSSLLDANVLDAGQECSDLPETYVIFITERDGMKRQKPLYRVERAVLGEHRLFEDLSHIIYVNGKVQDDTPLGWLMHDFHCRAASEMHYPELAKIVRQFKESEKGRKRMCKALEDMRKEAAAEAAWLKAVQTAKCMLAWGDVPMERIAEATGLTYKEIMEIADQNRAVPA